MRDKCGACGKFKRHNEGLVCDRCFEDWFDKGNNYIPLYVPNGQQGQRYIILACKKNNKLKK